MTDEVSYPNALCRSLQLKFETINVRVPAWGLYVYILKNVSRDISLVKTFAGNVKYFGRNFRSLLFYVECE